ncbi:T-cell-specific surface glycoprotein CD28 [Varanus komodoensis]|nr:T-cell-specific surface glycoprotein CD28 [Varanus komodoensis]
MPMYFSLLLEEPVSVEQKPLEIRGEIIKIYCNYISKREGIKTLKAMLLKGHNQTEVCSLFWKSMNHSRQSNNTELSCQVQFLEEEKQIIFDLQKLHVNQTDNYFCKIELLDPAPYETSTSHRGTLIHVQAPEVHCPKPVSILSMATAIGVLMFYGLVVTSAVYLCWRKAKKNKIVRNDYLNMTPWQFNGQKKRPHQPAVPARNYTAYRSWEP